MLPQILLVSLHAGPPDSCRARRRIAEVLRHLRGWHAQACPLAQSSLRPERARGAPGGAGAAGTGSKRPPPVSLFASAWRDRGMPNCGSPVPPSSPPGAIRTACSPKWAHPPAREACAPHRLSRQRSRPGGAEGFFPAPRP